MPEATNKLPVQVVNITSPALHSRLGKYFIGQSGMLECGNGRNAWGGLLNPADSGVDLYFDIFTITNFSDQSLLGEIWLNAIPPAPAARSSTVTAANQSIHPAPVPKAQFVSMDRFSGSLSGGVNIFDRIATPNSTLVSDSHSGSILIGPGGSFSILIKPPASDPITSTIVLTWWEEER